MNLPRVVGIVAEYNPLHNGHAFHLSRAREIVKADAVVIVLSSHFVQRGEPAIADKWERARMALASGANLVLELPTAFSCHNAGVFAAGAIDILASTGIVSHLAFGMENAKDPKVEAIVDILTHETQAFKDALRQMLSQGRSFVESQARAVDSFLPGAFAVMSQPNNILAIAYMKRMREKGYPIEVVPVERIGAPYHDIKPGPTASATAVRRSLWDGNWDEVSDSVPPSTMAILRRCAAEGRLFYSWDRLWRMVRTAIIRSEASELKRYAEMKEGLERRILREAWRCRSFEELISSLACRRYPRGRLQRHLIHILLGVNHWTNRAYQRLGPAYIRLIGADGRGRALLRQMRSTAALPVISRISLPGNSYASEMLTLERRASEMWELLVDSPDPGREARSTPVMDPRDSC